MKCPVKGINQVCIEHMAYLLCLILLKVPFLNINRLFVYDGICPVSSCMSICPFSVYGSALCPFSNIELTLESIALM